MMQEFTHHFQAMGTDVGLWLWQADEQIARHALAETEHFFRQTEARLSRFQPESELSQLNRTAGQPFIASDVLFQLVEAALYWRDYSGGIFDPTVLKALMAYGYDRSFETITPSSGRGVRNGNHASPTPAQVKLDRAQHSITLPQGVGLDLGGIAKGWTVQQAGQTLGRLGPALVDAGGDIVCVGTPPTGSTWQIGVSNPHHPDTDLALLTLKNEAVATSSLARRRWQYQGAPAHHLIDPRTGAPAATDLVSVTVIGSRLPEAEIHAKVALILGQTKGLAYLSAQSNLSALLVTIAGHPITYGPLEEKAYVYSNNFNNEFVNLV
jgi:thiamine biosynthesis lipoprotein